MNCKELQDSLSSGRPLTPQAADHARSCASCEALLRIFEENEQEARPDPSRVAAIQQVLLSSLEPVTPLPSNRRLALMAFAGAILLILICTLPFGYFGMRALSLDQIAIYYTAILFAGVLLAHATAQDMIPGTKRTVPRGALLAGIFLALAAIVLFIFRNSTGSNAVGSKVGGMPCFEIGNFTAAIAGMTSCFFLRRGCLITPVQTCSLAGTFSGLAGFGVLALHCPILRASHILIWHLGAMGIAGCAGAVFGLVLELLPRSRRITASVIR